MTILLPDRSQRTAARVAGCTYLLALVTGIFAEEIARDRLIVSGDAAATARNILAHEQLFRLGVASNVVTFAADVVLITALYVVLETVSRNLALAALIWRVIETMVLAVSVLADLDALQALGGGYLQPFEADRIYALARLSLGAHRAAYQLGLLFFGFGSTLFCYLWWRSRYMPRVLAGWGVFASALTGVSAFVFLLSPKMWETIVGWVYQPVFMFELSAGFWLLIRGIRVPSARGKG